MSPIEPSSRLRTTRVPAPSAYQRLLGRRVGGSLQLRDRSLLRGDGARLFGDTASGSLKKTLMFSLPDGSVADDTIRTNPHRAPISE
jgi:hypothetical protein